MTHDPAAPSSDSREDAMFLKLVKTERIVVEGRSCDLRYFERRTVRGGCRYSCEVLLGAEDRIIIDDDSMPGLESRVRHLVPATIYCRDRSA
jgi:hypothetical protein